MGPWRKSTLLSIVLAADIILWPDLPSLQGRFAVFKADNMSFWILIEPADDAPKPFRTV